MSELTRDGCTLQEERAAWRALDELSGRWQVVDGKPEWTYGPTVGDVLDKLGLPSRFDAPPGGGR
jgi:hypothetical protein